jgi:uracil-DNA glycosylase
VAVVLGEPVSQSADTDPAGTEAFAARAEAIRAIFAEKTAAELAAADRLAPGSDAVAWRGDLLADVFVVKGLPGPAEAAGGAAVSGADGEAADKALAALGHDMTHAFFTLSRPEPGIDPEACASRLRMQIMAVDPRLVVALDAEAGEDLGRAFGVRLPLGQEQRVLGRRMLAVDGLEASLADPARKKRVWRQLQAAKPAGPIY